MLLAEIGYLQTDLGRSLISADPARFTKTIADRTYYVLFELTRITDFIDWIAQAPASRESSPRQRLHALLRTTAEYLLVAIQVTQVFSVRLAILVLAMPIFVMFCLVAVVDGLVQRDLRRWGGGRESSFVYHWAKRAALPLLALTWILYLALPFSLHPSFVVLPFATLFALSVAVTASTFKKYL
jgi:integrating conjugative element membrane protein (TIGR03747 family)